MREPTIVQGDDDTHSNGGDVDSSLSIPESESRRILELRLLANYCNTVMGDMQSSPVHHKIYSLALQPDRRHLNFLYAAHALSATHMVITGTADPEIVEAQDIYFGLAIQEQRKETAHLDDHNSVFISFSAMYLMTASFAQLQNRSLVVPYAAPREWFEMGRVLQKVYGEIANPGSPMSPDVAALFNSAPNLVDFDEIFSEKQSLDEYSHLLTPQYIEGGSDSDAHYDFQQLYNWNNELSVPELFDAYTGTLRYIVYLQKALESKESLHAYYRRLLAFPMIIHEQFSVLLQQGRVRALIILAYFFALVSKAQEIWLVGDMGVRELRAMQESIPLPWQKYLRKPFSIANLVLPSA